jgi:phosphopantothenoylcysteine decarboxylase / phosphopantothenate---cysteine ligase
VYEPANPLNNKTVVVGVAGGIAAYKAVELVRQLTRAGAAVQVVMTERARHFIGELTFQALTGRSVFTELFDLSQESEIGHIKIADHADLMIIAPATANVIARLAAGMSDDVLTAVVLASRAPLLLAPSMNVNMWENPLTQANIERLDQIAGARFVGPGAGFLACRWTGPGRLAEPDEIVEAAARILTQQDLAGRTVVVSAGPTREAIDSVRFLSNRSSGKMGFALAQAAVRRGARVRLVSGPVSLSPPLGVDHVPVIDARAMAGAIEAAADSADAIIMAAAVADFRPREVAAHKLKKQALRDEAARSIALELNPDILTGLGAWRREQERRRPILVGFAAETEDLIDNARQKLERKGCDLVVANDVSEAGAGFDVDTNRVTLVTPDRTDSLELASKDVVAHRILDRVVALLERQ